METAAAGGAPSTACATPRRQARQRRAIDDPNRGSMSGGVYRDSVFGGKPTIRNRRLAVEHVLGMLAAGDTPEIVLQGYPWLEPDDIRACLVYARRMVGHERIDPPLVGSTER